MVSINVYPASSDDVDVDKGIFSISMRKKMRDRFVKRQHYFVSSNGWTVGSRQEVCMPDSVVVCNRSILLGGCEAWFTATSEQADEIETALVEAQMDASNVFERLLFPSDAMFVIPYKEDQSAWMRFTIKFETQEFANYCLVQLRKPKKFNGLFVQVGEYGATDFNAKGIFLLMQDTDNKKVFGAPLSFIERLKKAFDEVFREMLVVKQLSDRETIGKPVMVLRTCTSSCSSSSTTAIPPSTSSSELETPKEAATCTCKKDSCVVCKRRALAS